MHNLEDCVDSDTLMRVEVRAYAVDEGLWQVQWVDATRVEERGIKIFALIIGN
jgi:hypothetical protein